MTEANTSIKTMEFLAGRLALDFVNTIEYRDPKTGKPVNDFLTEDQHVLDFLSRNKIAIGQNKKNILESALQLREFLYTSFCFFHTQKGTLSPRAVTQLNEWRDRLDYREILELQNNKRLSWAIKSNSASSLSVLAPIFHSAVEIFLQDDPKRLRTCPADDCGWFFYDTSKSGKRVWCDMSDCGNREKARNFYHSHKE